MAKKSTATRTAGSGSQNSRPDTLDGGRPNREQLRNQVKRLGQFIKPKGEWPDLEGEVRFYAVQPEQVLALRMRLRKVDVKRLKDVALPEEENQAYHAIRGALVKVVQCCCRDERGILRYPGGKGAARLAQLDDDRLVQTAREIIRFNDIYAETAES